MRSQPVGECFAVNRMYQNNSGILFLGKTSVARHALGVHEFRVMHIKRNHMQKQALCIFKTDSLDRQQVTVSVMSGK